jgi:hypothetical protein
MEKKSSALNINAINKISFFTAILFCVFGGYYVYDMVSINPFLATDFGQWIMFSRYYLGQTTPNYLDPRSAHPIIPIIIAGVTSVTHNPITGIVLVSSLLFALYLFTVYIVVSELFSDPLKAIIGVFIIGYCQYIVIFMTTGLLPQLGAVIGINIGMWAIIRISKDINKNRYWLVLGITFLFMPFIHIPTFPIYIFTVSTFFFITILNNLRIIKEILFKFFIFCGIPSTLFIIYFAFFHDVIMEYATNPASLYRASLGNLIYYITINVWVISLTSIVLISVFIILVSMLWFRNLAVNKVSVVLIFFFCPIIFMFISYFSGIGTDYGRFIFYLPTPGLIVVLFLVANEKITNLITISSKYLQITNYLFWGYKFAVIIIIIGNLFFVREYFPKLTQSLGLYYGQSLQEVMEWFKINL